MQLDILQWHRRLRRHGRESCRSINRLGVAKGCLAVSLQQVCQSIVERDLLNCQSIILKHGGGNNGIGCKIAAIVSGLSSLRREDSCFRGAI